MKAEQRAAIARFAAAIEEPIQLGDAALTLGLAEDSELDLEAWRRELRRLGDELSGRIDPDAPRREQLNLLAGYLFAEVGLLGNEQNYYDPRNSYLHKVLERGLGIPISLAVIAIEVGRRAGLELYGVGFPAHFLVGAGEGLFLDAFHQGRILETSDCQELLERFTGGAIPFSPALLDPVDERQVLTRMLRNLKATHLRRGELDLALLDVDRLLLLDAGLEERRDRGLIQLARRDYLDAVSDLEAYLTSQPADEGLIRPRLEEARRSLGESA